MARIAALLRLGGVKNGGFEYGTGSVSANGIIGINDFGWFFRRSATTMSASYDNTVYHTGTQSMKLDTTDATGGGYVISSLGAFNDYASTKSLLWQPISPNTVYQYSVWIKTSTAATNQAYVTFIQVLSNFTGGTTTTTGKLSGTNDWTQKTGTFTSDATAAYVMVALWNGGGQVSTVWFDDITIIKARTTAATRKKILGVLAFDGGDSLETKALTGLTDNTVGTISFWFKHLNPSATELVGFAISRDASATQTEFFWDCDNQAGSKRIYCLLKTDGTNQWVANTGTNSLTNLGSGWHNFVITHDGVTPAFYIDGVSYTTTFTTSTDKTKWLKAILTDATSDADTLIVGALARNGSNLVPFNGQLAELRIYSRVLSAAEITALYQRNSVSTTNLQGEWLFNEGGGTTATDTSVNNNTLTFNGGAANPTWTNSRSAVA